MASHTEERYNFFSGAVWAVLSGLGGLALFLPTTPYLPLFSPAARGKGEASLILASASIEQALLLVLGIWIAHLARGLVV